MSNTGETDIYSAIHARLKQRAKKGFSEYGVTIDDCGRDAEEWLNEAIDEALDSVVYLEGLKRELKKCNVL